MGTAARQTVVTVTVASSASRNVAVQCGFARARTRRGAVPVVPYSSDYPTRRDMAPQVAARGRRAVRPQPLPSRIPFAYEVPSWGTSSRPRAGALWRPALHRSQVGRGMTFVRPSTNHDAQTARLVPTSVSAPRSRRSSGGVTRRAPIAAVITVAALAAGGCGTSSNPNTDLYRIPNISAQTLKQELEQPTSRGPDGYPVLAGPQRLSLGGIEYTTQGRDALQSWLDTPPVNQAAYKQAGRNLAIAFTDSATAIDRKLR